MRLLVVGANGLLGSNLVMEGLRRGVSITGTVHESKPDFDIPLVEFDLKEFGELDEILANHDPDVVINCAALTDVDACGERRAEAGLVNGIAPGKMAAACASQGISFVQTSTDYVFDGTARQPYDEGAATNPVQVYGESKLKGEEAVKAASEDPLIIRLSFLYGVHRARNEIIGFPAWVRTRLESDEAVPLFTDQWVTPSRAGQSADVILNLIEREATGVYHVACTSCVTPYEFGKLLVDALNGDAAVLTERSMTDMERAAKRPSYTCLDVRKVESKLERAQPTLWEDIERVHSAL